MLYYTRVSLQFLKLVGQHQKISLPSPSHFSEASASLGQAFSSLQNGAWKKVTLSQVGTLAGEGAKILGFFVVGEMVGRGSIVGYNIPGYVLRVSYSKDGTGWTSLRIFGILGIFGKRLERIGCSVDILSKYTEPWQLLVFFEIPR